MWIITIAAAAQRNDRETGRHKGMSACFISDYPAYIQSLATVRTADPLPC